MDLLKAMEAFVVAANSGSFASAAKKLGVTRALVSKQIQDLEANLGTRLFNRTTRVLTLTETGHEHLAFCGRLLSELSEQTEAIRALQCTPTGSLKMMAPKSFGNLHLGSALAEFCKQYPAVKVHLVLADDPPNNRHFSDEGLDLALKMSPSSENMIISKRVGYLRWLLCCSPEYAAQSGQPALPEELPAYNCLVHQRTNPGNIWILNGPNGQSSIRVDGSFTANSALALRAAVLSGLGIGFLPAYCVANDLKMGRLIEVLGDYPIEPRPVYLLYPHKQHIPMKVRLLIDFISRRFKSHGWSEAECCAQQVIVDLRGGSDSFGESYL